MTRANDQLRPLKSAHSCRRCGRWLEGEWADADAAQRVEIHRQMDAGRCDPCAEKELESGQGTLRVTQP